MAEPEPIPFNHIVALPHHRTGTMNSTLFPAAESYVRYTAESLLPDKEEEATTGEPRSEASNALDHHSPSPSDSGQREMDEDWPREMTPLPTMNAMEDFSSSSSGSEDGDEDSPSEETSTKTRDTRDVSGKEDDDSSSSSEAEDSGLDYQDGPFRRPATTGSMKAVLRSTSSVQASHAAAAATSNNTSTSANRGNRTGTNPTRSKHKRNARNNRFEARLSAVNGVISPSKLTAGQAPIPGKGGSAANVVRDRQCPLCLVAYARDANVKSHFAACVERNGNPQGLFWYSHPSIRSRR